jgi:integrase
MGEQLSIAVEGRAALLRSREEAFAVAASYVQESTAPNTRRTYKPAQAQWCAYCDLLGIPWGPIDAGELVTYLTHLSATRAPNTVRLHLSALAELDKATRYGPTNTTPTSIRMHELVRRWYKGWSRKHPVAPRRRAAALEVSDLERLVSAAAEPQRGAQLAGHVLRYARDRCLMTLGAAAALRGVEVTELELGDVAQTALGLTIRVRHSKTDQEGKGESVAVSPQARVKVCPVEAFEVWRRVRGDAPGPLFVGINRSGQLEPKGLSDRHVRRLIGEYAKRAGLGLNITAHSMRATLATLASSKGHGLERIMKHGRWKSAAVAAGYVRQGALFRDNVTGGLFD